MEVRAKKALGQHFLTDLTVAQKIVGALSQDTGGVPPETPCVASLRNDPGSVRDVLEIGPGMGVLTQYLLQREDLDLKLVELDGESVDYLLTHFPGMQGKLYQADYLRLDIHKLFPGAYRVIGNFPYNISSQIFFKILDDKDRIPEVGAFAPPPKVQSAVIRLRRNGRTERGCDEKAFKMVVKTAFNQRRKTLRNALKPLLPEGFDASDPVFDLRAERLSVEDFVALTQQIF